MENKINSEALHLLIKQVVRYAGDFRFAEAEELGIMWDRSCPSAEECKDKLNEKLVELWKMISTEPEPKDLPMVMMSELDEDEDEDEDD